MTCNVLRVDQPLINHPSFIDTPLPFVQKKARQGGELFSSREGEFPRVGGLYAHPPGHSNTEHSLSSVRPCKKPLGREYRPPNPHLWPAAEQRKSSCPRGGLGMSRIRIRDKKKGACMRPFPSLQFATPCRRELTARLLPCSSPPPPVSPPRYRRFRRLLHLCA